MFRIVLISIILTSLFSNSFGQVKQVIKVNGVFTEFNKAVEGKAGSKASQLVSSSTHVYFDSVLNLIKNHESAKLDSFYISNQVVVEWFKQELKGEDLSIINNGTFFQTVVSKGIFLKLKLNRFYPGKISLNGENAKALLTTFSDNEETECSFRTENKNWRIDVTSVIKYLVQSIK